ncbi:hypothetical protein K9L67_00825 [Candidatus Woesearchaeota archaeon]|nr:hypothetical protein [Candidatus Woesearchaeota archaeon]MCF7900749.1 hypothetical protein [Candidatus Woesearchaeota archaeon]MCF8012914.1 hypothetical protein [Candidatus Woesearchaeota archaeon]
MKKFCPKCGKTITKGKFCEDCREIQLDFKPIKIKLCPSGRIFHKGKWSNHSNIDEALKNLIKNSTKQKIKVIGLPQITEDLLKKTGKQTTLEFLIEYQKEEFVIPVETEITTSPAISKEGSTYFEGILQVRNITKEIKDYIKHQIEKNNIPINKISQTKETADYFFQKKNQMEPLALKIMRNFGGIISNNAQLFSYNSQTSKDIFRVNTLLTIPKFTTGDIIIRDDKPLKITGTKKIITTTNLELGKKFAFKLEEKDLEITPEKKYKTRITKTHPQLEIMDPETYQSVNVQKNPKEIIEYSSGQKVNVIKFKNQYYLY